MIPQKDEYLKSLARYRFLTARQLCRLHHSMGTLTTIYKYLRTLETEGWIEIVERQLNKSGNRQQFYVLSGKAKRYLRKQYGIVVMREGEPPGDSQMPHFKQVNDVRISAEKQGADQILSQRDLQKMKVVPDLWMSFAGRHSICLELDRGTELEKVWQGKIRRYIEWINTDYMSRFAVSQDVTDALLTVAVVICAPEPVQRARDVWNWLEKSLTREEASYFLIGAFYEENLENPDTLFQQEVYRRPFTDKKYALLA